jgi:hypothetical protein
MQTVRSLPCLHELSTGPYFRYSYTGGKFRYTCTYTGLLFPNIAHAHYDVAWFMEQMDYIRMLALFPLTCYIASSFIFVTVSLNCIEEYCRLGRGIL